MKRKRRKQQPAAPVSNNSIARYRARWQHDVKSTAMPARTIAPGVREPVPVKEPQEEICGLRCQLCESKVPAEALTGLYGSPSQQDCYWLCPKCLRLHQACCAANRNALLYALRRSAGK